MNNPTIIAAIISAVVAFFVLLVNYLMNRRSEKVQREIANQNIDANIVSKSRIEWIQEVRKATSKLISAYSELAKIEPNNSSEYLKKVVDFQEKNEILILFFGNDSVSYYESKHLEKLIYFNEKTSKFVVEEEIKQKLLERNTNKNKNDIIVFYLKTLKKYFDHFDSSYSKNIKYKDKWEKEKDENYERMIFPKSGGETVLIPQVIDDEGNEEMVPFLVDYDELAEKDYDYYVTKLNFFNIPKHIVNNMAFLSDVMRLYLKIEWNESKINQQKKKDL